MPTLHITDLPEELYQRIQERAQSTNKTVEAEVIALLERALWQMDRSQEAILAAARRRRLSWGGKAAAIDSVDLLREDRER